MYQHRIDVRSLDLRAWARWVAADRPLHFSLLGDSAAFRPFETRHGKTCRASSVLWQEWENSRASEHVARLMRIDSRLIAALEQRELRLLLAATAPSGTGAPLPLTERAALAGVSPDALREIRRRALELID